ncbi:MAG: hypothetical protein ACWA5X_05085 [bacterium]
MAKIVALLETGRDVMQGGRVARFSVLRREAPSVQVCGCRRNPEAGPQNPWLNGIDGEFAVVEAGDDCASRRELPASK